MAYDPGKDDGTDNDSTPSGVSELKAMLDAKTKATEFAGYLATAAERHLAAVNHTSMVWGEDGQVHDADEVLDAEQSLAEAARSLRSAIYEFRKRASNAAVKPRRCDV